MLRLRSDPLPDRLSPLSMTCRYDLNHHAPFQARLQRRLLSPIGDHVFPGEKVHRVHDRLIADGVADATDFLEPQPATDLDISSSTPGLCAKVEDRHAQPARRNGDGDSLLAILVESFWLAAGDRSSPRVSARRRLCISIGGGFHHAFPEPR